MNLESCNSSRLWRTLEIIRCSEGVEENHGNLGQDSRCSGQVRANAQRHSTQIFLFCTASRQSLVTALTSHSACGHSMAQADSRRSEIVEARPVHVRSVVDNVVLEQDFFLVLPFSLLRIIPKIFYGHICLHVVLNRRQRGEALEPSKKHYSFRYRRAVLSL